MPARPPFKARAAWTVEFVETAPAWKSVTATQPDAPDDRDLERLALAGDGNVAVTPPTEWTAPR
jgi:hypothetical protein